MERRVREWRAARAEQLQEGVRGARKRPLSGERAVPVETLNTDNT
jgi:hypothetical protein